jgi:hypothetical protein
MPHMIQQPKLIVDSCAFEPGRHWVDIRNLESGLLAAIAKHPDADDLLRSILRVRVVEVGSPVDEELPDVLGRFQVLEDGVRFIPHFPFESGVRYRATFDPRPLAHTGFSQMLTLEYSPASETDVGLTDVEHVFPSADSLPENLLRFYVRFSNSMQRGRAEEQISILGPDGCVAPDVLYRPPVELWDRSMRHLTVLLDPGRLKRGVGPNRELGPPLKSGQEYTLAIGAGMLDLSGRALRESFHKTFRVTEALRESIAPEQWRILPPASGSYQPLRIIFPRPLDWALLWHGITIASGGGKPIAGRVAIDRDERRWSFTPLSPWVAGAYRVRVASELEDVCGNDLLAPFDSPLRAGTGKLPSRTLKDGSSLQRFRTLTG